MLTESFQSIAIAARQVLRNWRIMIVLATLYASLIAALYLFVTIREASTAQVFLSLALVITAPFLFFVLQTAGASETGSARLLLREALRGWWKLLVVSLPLIALAIGLTYLFGKAQTYFIAGDQLNELAAQYQPNAGKPELSWTEVLLTGSRYLALGLILPLLAMHLWIASVRRGFTKTIRSLNKVIVGAFAPYSVLIYMAGFLVFGVAPYVVLFKSTPSSIAWMEFSLFVARLLLVFALTLFGWVLTMRALAICACGRRDDLVENS